MDDYDLYDVLADLAYGLAPRTTGGTDTGISLQAFIVAR